MSLNIRKAFFKYHIHKKEDLIFSLEVVHHAHRYGRKEDEYHCSVVTKGSYINKTYYQVAVLWNYERNFFQTIFGGWKSRSVKSVTLIENQKVPYSSCIVDESEIKAILEYLKQNKTDLEALY